MILRSAQPEFEILGGVRTLQIGRERFDVFEFKADVTEYRPALALTDGWDAVICEGAVPSDWREMADAKLVAVFRAECPEEFHSVVNDV